MNRNLIIAHIFLSIFNVGHASTFSDYLGDAIQNDYDYLITIEKIKGNEVEFDISRSRLLPSINAQLNNYRVDQTRNDGAVRQDQSYNSQGNSLQITAPVYSPKLYRDFEYQEKLHAARDLERQVAREDLVVRLSEKFIAVISEKHICDRLLGRIEAYSTYYDSGLRQYTGGRLSENERDERHKLLLNTKYELIGASQRLVNAKRELAKILGRAPEKLGSYSIDDRLVLTIQNYLSTVEGPAVDAKPLLNTKVKLRQVELDAAKLKLTAISALHYPDVNFFGQAAENKGESNYFTATRTSAIYLGFQITIPLYSGGGVTDRERQQLFKIKEAEIALERELKNLGESTFQFKANLRSYVDSYALMSDSFKLIEKKVQRLQKAVSESNKSKDELVPAMVEYFDLSYNLKAKKLDILRQYINLEIARGAPTNELVINLDGLVGK